MNKTIFEIKDQVALRLRESREALSHKPEDFANAAGVSRATQYNYESGKTPPDVNYLQKIQTLGVDVPYALFGTRTAEFASKAEQERLDWQLFEMAFVVVEADCLALEETCPHRLKYSR
jgi:transcriptional regulator with XRE-family HTH domain